MCLILGGAGFIGSHVAAELVRHKRVVIVADKQPCSFYPERTICTQFIGADLRRGEECGRVFAWAVAEARHRFARPRVWAFLFAADMGGMGYIGSNEGAILLSNTAITSNTLKACLQSGVERMFVSSSACVYPVELQTGSGPPPALREEMAWPAQPQDGYGLEKLYGEQLLIRAAVGTKLEVRVARFHNVYGPRGTWIGGREKAPAAFLRKALFLRELDAAQPTHGMGLEVWGDGSQTRTFCYITDAVSGILALMCSDVSTPVNLGSNEAVTIKELALLAGEIAGFDRSEAAQRISLQLAGPIGVQSRSADLSKAALYLGWTPQVPLESGMRLTAAWLGSEMQQLRHSVADSGLWKDFLSSGLTSPHARRAEVFRFGLLLPITSRVRGRDVVAGVRAFLASLQQTALVVPSARAWQFDVLFGVDAGDAVCDVSVDGAVDLMTLVREQLPIAWILGRVTARVLTFRYPAGSICRIWADLAAEAFASGVDFTVLLGDDVVMEAPCWPDAITDAFQRIAHDAGLPFGFGCVAFADKAFPGFPTFPVVHRLHADIFNGRIFPSTFKNQDADPFLFQLYRAFGAARLEPEARLNNTIGGANDARYRKIHVPWTGSVLRAARDAAAQWLDQQLGPSEAAARVPVITLDVVVPTYRTPLATLEAILALRVPDGVSTQFTIVCDRPTSSESLAIMAALQAAHCDDPMVRIRINDVNLGAGPSRNRGLAESAADWVLFLDDDVEPDVGILEAYAVAIREHPCATGFIGNSVLPIPKNARQAGVHIAGVAFFWGIAQAIPTHTELPWGVTANLCVRRPPPGTIEFDDAFPRTGGGEDIDFCLRLREYMRRNVHNSEGFVAVPAAKITHPWWDGGVPLYSHFSGWAYGDGQLIDSFPQLTYHNLPDLAETLFVLGSIGAAQLVARMAAAYGALAGVPRLYWLRPLSTRGLVATAAVCAACIAADVVVSAWVELLERPSPHSAHLPLKMRMSGILEGLLIRTISEAGRLAGHRARGTLLRNFGRRFNWFGFMWAGAPQVERCEALRRNLSRVGASIAVLALIFDWRGRCRK